MSQTKKKTKNRNMSHQNLKKDILGIRFFKDTTSLSFGAFLN